MNAILSGSFIRPIFLLTLILFSLPVFAVVRYVKVGNSGPGTSWTMASGDLQLMINESAAGDTIWVAEGIYVAVRPADNLNMISAGNRNNAIVLKSGVKIFGGFNGTETILTQRDWLNQETIISGDLTGNDGAGFNGNAENAYHVLISAAVDSNTILDGFIISGGKAKTTTDSLSVNGIYVYAHRGAGWYNVSGSPVLNHIVLKQNFIGNNNGGGWYNFSGNPRVDHVTICGNQALYGSGVYNNGGSPVVSNTAIYGNRSGNAGAGWYNNMGSPVVVNATFASNEAGGALNGSAWHNASNGGSPFITNSIFWGNSNNAIIVNSGGVLTLTNSIVQGGFSSGSNIISIDPGFIAPEPFALAPVSSGNYRLLPCSPAINAGDTAGFSSVTGMQDADNLPRVANDILDLGAYEYQYPPWSIPQDTLFASLCSPDSILFNGNYYHTTGYYADTLISSTGCDSIAILALNVYPLIRDTITITICAGQSYTFNSLTYTTPQTGLLDTFTTAGCDSIVTLNLAVHPYLVNTVNAGICAGQSYTFNGITYSTAQTGLLDTFTTAGCDSIVTLNLSVNPYLTSTINAAICAGQTYTFNGVTYSTAQTGLLDTFTTAGCDSIVILNLAVQPYLINTVNATICAGQIYTFNGITYTTAQTGLLDTFATLGCDSIVSLNLTVYPYLVNTVNAAICAGQSYTFNGITYTTAQTGLLDTFATLGCDSIVTLNLTGHPYLTDTVNVAICAGETYTFNGITYSTAQTGLLDTFATLGCDSIVTLNLTVHSYLTSTVNATICAGQSYTFNGITYSTAQTGLLDTFVTLGCDSIVTLNLSVNPYLINTVNTAICAGQTYTFNGITYSTAQTGLLDTFATLGCDSIVTLNLTVHPFLTNTVNGAICAGQSYTFNGITYSTAQTGLLDTFTTLGCDSIVTLNLTVHPYLVNTVNAAICAGQSYTFNGITYTTAQTGLLDTFNTLGCDSIVTLNLSVNPYLINTVNAAICAGQTYTFNGITYSTAQTGLLDTFVTLGCDSIVTLNLSVNPYLINTVNATICAGQTYTFNGITYNTAQTGLLDTFTTLGCDSIVTLNLTVHPYLVNTVNATICAGQTYTFNGTTYSTTQTGLLDTFATLGCDSIVTLNLSVNPYLNNTVNVAICAGETYTFNGITYSTAQTGLLDTFATLGCDSIVTLNLNILPVTGASRNESICPGSVYHFNGQILDTAGIYYDTLAAANGCDSVITLNLAIGNFITNTIDAVICAGQSYLFNGISYSTAQTGLRDTFSTSGCDSIVTLNLVIAPYIAHTVNATICTGESYVFNGIVYTATQTGLLDTFGTSGCDSIVTLNLSVETPVNTPLYESMCQGGIYNFNGQDISAAGIYYDTLVAFNGCDSIVVLNLSIDDFITTTVNAVICAGESYMFNGQVYTTSQTGLQDTFSTLACDSIVTLNLEISPYLSDIITDTICAGQSYMFNGITYTTSQTGLQDTFPTSGCDSIVIANLYAWPAINVTLNETICQGDTYNLNGQSITTAGTYYDTLVSFNGCDSVVTLYLVVNSFITHTVNAAICSGQSYVFNGISYTTPQTGLSDTFTTLGCDSIVTLHLNVSPYLSHTINATICTGESYFFNDTIYTTPQTGLPDTFPTQGCDSVVILNLNVVPIINTILNESICQGGVYNFNGQNISLPGTYQDTLTAFNGCDSVVTLTLSFDNYITHTVNTAICAGQSYLFNGNTYNTSQTGLLDTFTTAGCDSIVTLNLFVNPYITNTVNATICAGDSYIFNGITYTTPQTGLLDTFATTGCDSIVTLDLFVNPYITNTVNATICAGDAYIFNGITYTTTQTGLLDTFTTAGCDSIVTLNLFVNPYITNTVNATICAGDAYIFNGITYTTPQTGLLDTFTTISCDSIVTLNLFVNPYITNTVNATICAGDAYIFNGITYTTPQTGLLDTFTTAGCDSIVTLNLNVNPYITNSVNATICAGASYIFNGITYTTPQTGLLDTFATSGCDSIVTLNLAISPYITNTVNVTICSGQSYVFNGITYTSSQNGLLDTFTTAGCDSIVTLNLNVNPYITNSVNATICAGASYIFNGITYTTPQTGLLDTFATSGCDSIVTLNLAINPYITNAVNVTICSGQSYVFNGITYTSSQNGLLDTFSTSGCDSIVTLILTVTMPVTATEPVFICPAQLPYSWNGIPVSNAGISAAVYTSTSSLGCDSITFLDLYVLPAPETINMDSAGCGQVTFGQVIHTRDTLVRDTIFSASGCDSIIRHVHIIIHPNEPLVKNIHLSGCDQVLFEGNTYFSDTLLIDTLYNRQGCDSIVRKIMIETEHFKLELQMDPQEPYAGEIVHLTAQSAVENYQIVSWTPADWFSKQHVAEQYLGISKPGTIIVTGESPGGCRATDSISFKVLTAIHHVFVPNAFSPNGDGVNDIFAPRFHIPRAYHLNVLKIFDRWGKAVYHSSGNKASWNGQYLNGLPAETATYHFYIEVTFSDKERVVLKGDLTLIR